MKKMLTTLVAIFTLSNADFTRSGSIVTDNTTDLQWQDDSTVVYTATWQEAIDRCEALELDGYTDWRLPNMFELLSLVDDSKFDPSISSVFVNITSDFYWSSTTYVYVNHSSHAWIGDFSHGYNTIIPKDNKYYVRCVSSGGKHPLAISYNSKD